MYDFLLHSYIQRMTKNNQLTLDKPLRINIFWNKSLDKENANNVITGSVGETQLQAQSLLMQCAQNKKPQMINVSTFRFKLTGSVY